MSNSIIQCQNLSHYFAGQAALSNISFEVSTGAPIGLVGPNGAGKTTLLSILSGYLHPSAGTVSLFGHKPGASELSGKISALPQDARLDPIFTIGKQLTFFARLQGLSSHHAHQEAMNVLESVDLKDSFYKKPETLSHGMAKRVSIAQALIGKPQLILLDEPTAGLDPVNTRNIRSIISELSADTTFIISSHDLTELGRLCQQVMLLEKGIMNTTQINIPDQNQSTQYLTLQTAPCPATELISKLNLIDGVIQVSNPQKDEYIIEYDAEVDSKIDIKTILCLSDNNWHYRQIRKGKTLEEQLFFED